MKRLTPVAAAVLALATSLGATVAFGKDYVIVTKGQGVGSTNLDQAVAAAGGTLTGRQQDIGVAFASSDNAGFAATLISDSRVQDVVEDVIVPWIDPAVSLATRNRYGGEGRTGRSLMKSPGEPSHRLTGRLGGPRR
jgi:hypothetical protein